MGDQRHQPARSRQPAAPAWSPEPAPSSGGSAGTGAASGGSAGTGAAQSGTGAAPGGFAGTGAALAAAAGGLAFLAAADAALLPADELAGCLRALEALESGLVAARSRILSGFTARAGHEADGHGAPGTWLTWQARVTRGAASGAVGWMRRLDAHPLVGAALAAGGISVSWARQVCAWSDLLPAGHRQDADRILLAAAAGGAQLADLSGLAGEMHRRAAPPDPGPDAGPPADDGGFADRGLQLDLHFRGAGHLTGDLTAECAAALSAVLESLAGKAGPEDDRTRPQRDHDALEEACRRLAGAGGLPDVAGQPAQVQLHMSLSQLRRLDGAAEAEAAWAAGRAAGDDAAGWVRDRAAAEAYACDAQIIPVVTGHVDPGALAALVHDFLARHGWKLRHDADAHETPAPGTPAPGTHGASGTSSAPRGGGWPLTGDDSSGNSIPDDIAASSYLPPATLDRLTATLLRYAAGVLSGPAGLAAHLRAALLPGICAGAVSLPLDIGTATRTVPPHLRRAVTARDRHCAFPGCAQQPARCHAHHLIPWSRGGPTALHNLALLCPFHHLVIIHRRGWTLTLNADGTTTATSPDRTRTLHSHGPPPAIAA